MSGPPDRALEEHGRALARSVFAAEEDRLAVKAEAMRLHNLGESYDNLEMRLLACGLDHADVREMLHECGGLTVGERLLMFFLLVVCTVGGLVYILLT